MAELVMDNPFSAGGQGNYTKTIQDLQGCIAKLKDEYEDSRIPVSDDNQDLQRFCAKLEYLFQAGIKAKSSLLGGKKDYWNYICDCVGSNKSLNDGIRFVKATSELKTNLGRGRALIRFALMHQRLADTLQQCVYNTAVTKDWFQAKAVWFQKQAASDIITALYDLNDLRFDLDSRGYDLDTSWPTFARKQFSGAGAWQPPSRTISIGSLNSTSQDVSHSVDADRQSQILEQVENEKLAAEHHIQELTEENKTLKDKVLELQLNANERLKATSEFEVMCGKLADELALKEETWAEKEKLHKMQLHESTKAQESSPSAASAVDMLELKGKLTMAEKKNKVMKIDITCLEKEMGAKVRVDTVKNQLIDMQDRKIGKQTDEVKRYQVRVESLLEGKQADVQQILTLTKRLEEYSVKIDDSQSAYKRVLNQNSQLTEMLHDVEEKGSKIGKIAKEKLTKYKQDNEELKEKVTKFEDSKQDTIDGSESQISILTEEKYKLQSQLKDLQAKLDDKDAAFHSNQSALVQNTAQIVSLKSVIESLQSNSSSTETGLTQDLINTKEENAKLKANLESSSSSAQKMEKLLDEKSAMWKKEKETLLNDIDVQATNLEEINTKLADKMKVLEQCEKQMELEKAQLVKQMEAQGGEIDQLKLELTSLSKLLEQAGFNEIAANPRACVESLIESKNTLNKTVTSMHASQTELLTQLENATEKISEATNQLQITQEEKQILQNLADTHQESISSIQEKYSEKSSQFHQLLNTFTDLENQLGVIEGRMADNNKTVVTLNETIAEKDKILQAKDDKYESIVEKLNIVQQSLQEVENDRDGFQRQLHDKGDQYETLQTKLTDATNAIERLESRKSDLEKVNIQNEEKLNSLMKEVENKNMYISEKETDVKQTSENVETIQHQLESAETYKKLLEEKIRTLTEKFENKEKEVLLFTESVNSKSQDLEGKLIEASAQNISLGQQNLKFENIVKEMETEMKHLEENKTKLTLKIDTLENSCDNYIQENTHLKSENVELSSKWSKLESINAEIVVQSDQMLSEKTELSQRLDESNKLQNEILSQMDETNSQFIIVKDELSAKNEQILLTEKQKSALATDLENNQALLYQLNQQVEALEIEKSDQSEETNKSFFELKDKLGSLECENDQLREELQNSITKKDELFTQMTEQHTDFKTEISSLSEQVKNQTEMCSEFQSKNDTLSQEIETFQVSITEKDEYIVNVDRQKREVEEKMDRWKESLDGKEQESAGQLQEVEKTMSDLKETIEQKESEIEMLKCAHEQEMKAVQFELSTEQMQHQSVQQEYEGKERDYNTMQDKISSLEEQIEALQTDIEQNETQIQSVNTQHHQQVVELQEKMTEKDHECQELTEDLFKKSQSLDIELKENQIIKKKLTEKESETDKSVGKLNTEIASLEDENEQLKKKLIQLIKEKDTLWKKSDKLAYKQRLRAQVWADSDNVLNCVACNAGFGFMLRKHHCRLCGQIYCHYCCNNWVMTSFSNKKERVCGPCLLEQSHLESASEGEDSDTTADSRSRDGFEETFELPAMLSPKWKDKDLLYLNPDEAGDDEDTTEVKQRLVEAELNQAIASDVTAHISQSEGNSLDEAKLLSMTDESKSGRLQETKVQSTPSSRSDEPYDLITPAEVEDSQETVVPDPYTHMTGMLDHTHFESGPVEAEPELWINAGRAYAIPLSIDTPGTTLKWEFTTYPKDINFSLSYRECEWTEFQDSEVLIPMCKCNSHKKAVNGELTARKAGIYTLIFDNKTSRFTSKKLSYTLELTDLARNDSED